MSEEYNLYHHELLDRLHCICVMYDEMIVKHDSDDILSQEEKDEIGLTLGMTYQLVGQRMHDNDE